MGLLLRDSSWSSDAAQVLARACAHAGGSELWRSLRLVSLVPGRLSGLVPRLKGVGRSFEGARAFELEPSRQRARFVGYPDAEHDGVFDRCKSRGDGSEIRRGQSRQLEQPRAAACTGLRARKVPRRLVMVVESGAPSYSECSGKCVDLSPSRDHCGKCDGVCNASQVCAAGKCGADCGTKTPCPARARTCPPTPRTAARAARFARRRLTPPALQRRAMLLPMRRLVHSLRQPVRRPQERRLQLRPMQSRLSRPQLRHRHLHRQPMRHSMQRRPVSLFGPVRQHQERQQELRQLRQAVQCVPARAVPALSITSEYFGRPRTRWRRQPARLRRRNAAVAENSKDIATRARDCRSARERRSRQCAPDRAHKTRQGSQPARPGFGTQTGPSSGR
jgi:hypothetical protein